MASSEAAIQWSEEELRDNVGQLFIVGFHGHVASDHIKKLVTYYRVGTVILFSRNIDTGEQLTELTKSLQEIANSSGHSQPLFISIDQENGLVTRIKPPVAVQLPGSMALGATNDPSNAYNVAAATAQTLQRFGINMNYAPIADINSEPKNPVIGVRSPSDDPETVGRFVSAQIKGFWSGRVVPCVKHFPGHGDTAVDSHFGLPTIEKTRFAMDQCELLPFRRAVTEGVDAVMTAHIVLPLLHISLGAADDSNQKLPASLNPDIINILRNEMKYEGLIVSDCLEMDGVRAPYGTETAAVMALKAGTDSVMICHTIAAQVGAIEKVMAAVRSGELSQSAIQISGRRIRALKKKFLASETSDNTKVDGEVQIRAQTELASNIYGKSTTVARSHQGVVPISSHTSSKFLFLAPGKLPKGSGVVESGKENEREMHTPSTYFDILRNYDLNIEEIRYHDGVSLSDTSRNLIDEADVVIFATRNASLSPYQRDLGLSLGKRLGEKMIAIATCDPYDFLEDSNEIKNYIVTYEPTDYAFRSACDVLFGVTQSSGTLPVSICPNKHNITSGSNVDIDRVWYMWQHIFPKWPIERLQLSKILSLQDTRLYTHDKGFCLAFYVDAREAKISIIGVLPAFRGQGIGTALMKTAQENMRSERSLLSFGIGSVFPRLWPGVPIDFPQSDKDFFSHRGYRKSTAPTSRDLYKNITMEVAPLETLEKVSKSPLTFSAWSKNLEEECLVKQRANFKNIGWVKAYETLAAKNQHHEVMVAFDESGGQVGWALMCSQEAAVTAAFPFLSLLPSKEKTGLIGCVGVDNSARGKGVGLALMVKAIENMRDRGIEGVLIDWVVIRGFYEILGFEPYWEYEEYEW
ncbi:putative beta-N-acetylglucosaminidase [Amylocarpus encephaloides]|uniref:Beta-N-acetylglucosaminidase n=1 Tax=Amylocarpus encephaloides TaxID=45428 RepID=A0A9P7YT89_9HELO|nr:putative beta-N-acetylglucosaminidase [Amylocarpus encephaloides]